MPRHVSPPGAAMPLKPNVYESSATSTGSASVPAWTCVTVCASSGVRAEPYAYGSPEWVEIELFLMARAKGMVMEAPAVRP